MKNRWLRRFLALVLFAAPVALLGIPFGGGRQTVYLPGPTSSGHHQLESQCGECHVRFAGASDASCLRCHGQALSDATDSHAPAKFDDPGKAAQLAVVDARSCLPCHTEHRPEARARSSVTMALTACLGCHARIGQERASHRAFTAESCADAGCHNYHDNRALYRDFLVKHRDEPPLLPEPRVPVERRSDEPVALPAVDAPEATASEPSFARAVSDWSASSHARARVTCTACHEQSLAGAAPQWRNHVDDATCARCHAGERAGWAAGKHGMRAAAGLTAMTPALARLPMKATAHDRTVGCTACHDAHLFDRRWAAVEACEGCHEDAHTRAYRDSPHALAWAREQRGEAPPGSGVSCATCHLPRRATGDGVAIEHDQNANLRPANRMLRPVCMSCHGVGFSLAALADPALAPSNFSGTPGPAVRTGMDLIKEDSTHAK
jgi:hypothetical protein